jgi:hypothetical protein
MERFAVAIRGCFEATYLRQPTRDDIEKQMSINEKAWISRDVWKFGLHALDLEELSSGMVGSVPRQRQEQEHHP